MNNFYRNALSVYHHCFRKQILAASLGNTLEWFDFGLFIFLAPIIGENFFSKTDPTLATIAAYIVFAAGFICRPLGGILFGHAGDTWGRVKTLRISILVITLSTLCIGLLPTYEQIGIWAPILFTVFRLTHGLSIGGEYSGVMIYLAESAPQDYRGLVTSFAASGANIGFLLATAALLILTHWLSPQALSAWGWRIPFVVTSFIGTVLIYFRFRLRETPVFSHLKEKDQLSPHPLVTALKNHPKQLLKIFGLTGMGATLYYLFFGFMPSFLRTQGLLVNSSALILQGTFLFLMLFFVPIASILGDRFGRRKVLIITAIGIIIFAIPNFYLLQTQILHNIFFAFLIATLLSSFDQGNTLTAVVETCPANIRYSGIAFAYNLGIAVFGGTTPVIATMLYQEINLMAPAYYLMLVATISLIAAFGLIKTHAKPRSLR